MALYINRQAPQSGISSILAQRGRMGDTELVHMTKPEVQRLQQTGLLSLNPQTGLPEYFLGDVWKGIKNTVKNFIKPENLIPTIAGIALPALAGPALGGTAFGRFVGPLGTSAILGGLGTAGGKLLTGADLEEASTAGFLSGAMRYGTGRLSQALGPDPVEGATMSANKFAKERPTLLGKFAGSEDYLDLEGDLLEYGMDDLSDWAEGGGLDNEASILNQLNQLQQSRIGNYPNPIVAQAPVLPIKNSNFAPMDFYDDQGNRILAEGQAESWMQKNPLADIGGGGGLSKAQSFPSFEFAAPRTFVPTPELSQAEFNEYQKFALEQANEEGQFNLTDTFSPEEQEGLARKAAIEFNKNLPTNKAAFNKAMVRLQDPYSNTRDIVSKQGLDSLTSADFYESLPLAEIAALGYPAFEGSVSSKAMALQAQQEQDFLEEQANQGIGGFTGPRTVYRRSRPRTPSLNTAQILAAATRGGGLGGASGFYGPTQYTPVRTAEEGGLVALEHGGRPDFEGMVEGDGHGMEDNVIMDIKQKGGLLAVSPKEYVVPADVMSMLGNGNPDDGANKMDKFIGKFRQKKYGRPTQPPEMDGGTALQSLMKG